MAQTAVKEREPRTVVRESDYAVLYSDGTILVKNVRAAYPHCFEPYKGEDGDGKGKFGIVGLMPKTKEYFPAKDIIRDYVNDIIKAQKLPGLPAANKFMRDGDLRPDKPEFVGNFTISASEVRRPILRGKRRDPKTQKPVALIPGKDDDVIYGGCWVNILIRPWYQNNKFGKKVNAGLVAVQFVRDDEAFGQGRISEDEVDDTFGNLDDDDSGYDDALDAGLEPDELDL